METQPIAVPEYYTTTEIAEVWNTKRDTVASWCKAGHIPGATKEIKKGRWSIPRNAKRPLDAKLIQELLWQLLEVANSTRKYLDLSDWGVSPSDLQNCLETLAQERYLTASGNDLVHLTQRALKLLGRYGRGEDQVDIILRRTSCFLGSTAGCFCAALIKDLVAP